MLPSPPTSNIVDLVSSMGRGISLSRGRVGGGVRGSAAIGAVGKVGVVVGWRRPSSTSTHHQLAHTGYSPLSNIRRKFHVYNQVF